MQIGKIKIFLRAGQMAELDARRTEVLGKSAKIIQQKFRSHLARKEFLALRNAAINLQSLWRGIFVHEYVGLQVESYPPCEFFFVGACKICFSMPVVYSTLYAM